MLTLGSLFDGIGGWPDAAIRAGVKPLWASEIEPFPAAVTAHHYPGMKQLGDITKINVDELEPVDIICAGSPCFVAGTSILTFGGMKAVENVKVGNAVLGDDCKWHKVVKTMVNPASVIYTIKAQGLLETKATANHPIYVRHMKRHYPTCEDGRRCNERVFSKPEYVAVKDLKKGDFIGFPILQYENNRMNITPEEAWLVGRYIADGYVNNSPRKDRPEGQYNHKVIFCIGKGKVEYFKAHLDKYHVCLKKDVTVTKGEIISERLMFFCLMCGKGAGNKEIPGDFLNLPNNLLKALLDGYMSGDGCKSNGINKATTISKDLALSLQVAVHKAYGVPAKIYFNKRPPKAEIQGREINQHDTYQVTWLDEVSKQSQAIVEDGYIWQPIRKITKEEVKTSVYNFEVKDVHSYTANGMMVHNCQDLSVAGKRKGLAGERSGLFRTAIDIVHRLRERTGKPRFFVWENVPGAFSSNGGADFRAVLEEIGQTEIPMPKRNKWATSGMVQCENCEIAWRVLDAQYWGVPQRRKRIFLVADFAAADRRAAEILFVEQGLHGDSSESEGEREETPSNVGASIDSASYGVITKGNGEGILMKERHCSLACGGGQAGQGYPAVLDSAIGVDIYNNKITGDKVTTLTTINTSTSTAPKVMTSIDSASGCLTPWDAQPNRAVHPINLQVATRHIALGRGTGFGVGNNGAPAYTLEAGHSHGVAVYDMTHADEVMRPVTGDKSNCLNSRMGTGGNQVPVIHDEEQHKVRRLTPTELRIYLQEVDTNGATQGIKALYVLWENYGAKKVCEWCVAIMERIQQAKILQQGVYEKSVSTETSQGNELDDSSLPCPEYIADWLLRDMWQQQKCGCAPQRWEPAEQFAKKLNESVQKLSHENPSSKGELCDMRETSKGAWLLREAFTEIQKIWESFNVESWRQTKTVRRLTPLEAERLQGWPDGYTDIPLNGKPASDANRYKALGNGMAQPCARFVIRRIAEVSNGQNQGYD